MNGLCSKSFRKNKSETNLGDWRKNSIVTLRDTLCSKIKRPKGLLLLLNGIPIVGKIFRNLGQGGYRLQRPLAREFVSSSACFETQGRRKFWKSVASINTVGIICPPGWDRVTFSVKIWLGAWAPRAPWFRQRPEWILHDSPRGLFFLQCGLDQGYLAYSTTFVLHLKSDVIVSSFKNILNSVVYR